MHKYADELEGELYIFERAEKRMNQEEDKKNRREDLLGSDAKQIRLLKKEYEEIMEGIKARKRVRLIPNSLVMFHEFGWDMSCGRQHYMGGFLP